MDSYEWKRSEGGALELSRKLPNGIEFGTRVHAHSDHVLMAMWLVNGSDEPLTDLRVQNCVMLKAVAGFDQQTNDNKIFRGRYAVARSATGNRWVISGWDPIHRCWGNAPCPCLHADPKFPDCAPGETQRLRGWLSFYEGTNIDKELDRIETSGWYH